MAGRRARRGAAAVVMTFGGLLGIGASHAQEPLPLRLDTVCESCASVVDPHAPSMAEAMLAVQVNLESKGDFVVLIAQDGDVLVREADLSRADLRRASLDRVDLTSATLKDTRIDLQAAVMLAELHGAVVDLGE